MLNTRNISEYLSNVISLSGSNDYNKTVKRILNKFSSIENDSNKELSDFTRDELASAFGRICKTKIELDRYKTEVKKYLNWYERNYSFVVAPLIDMIDTVSAKDIDQNAANIRIQESYFSSQKSFAEFLQKYYVKPFCFDARAALILSWYGFSTKDMASLYKDDIDIQKKTVNGTVIDEPFFSMIVEYADLEYFHTLRSTARCIYGADIHLVGNYLFRQQLRPAEFEDRAGRDGNMTKRSIDALHARRKGVGEEKILHEKKLNYNLLSLNKRYCDFYVKECALGKFTGVEKDNKGIVIPEEIRAEIKDGKIGRDFIASYLAWRDCFYPIV